MAAHIIINNKKEQKYTTTMMSDHKIWQSTFLKKSDPLPTIVEKSEEIVVEVKPKPKTKPKVIKKPIAINIKI